ncbi:MAG: NAD(P)-dependent oxidoreductase [Pedobacter sp.]|nr:NAD(P)-dependent oxidoreductase [Pedobacter sp.]
MVKNVALVTGGTGFTGSYLIRRLVADGWLVHAIVRPESNLKALETCSDQIKLHTHDGSTLNMISILNSTKPNVVFHLAAITFSQHTPDNLKFLLDGNILFSTQLAEAMAENGVDSIVNTGTFWQHFENKEYEPSCLYAATKQAFETILQYYIAAKGFKAITLKLFDSYGPNDFRPKLFNLLKEAGISKKLLPMSPGEQLIDLVYIDDVIDAFIIAANRLLQGKVYGQEHYAVSSGKPVKLKSLVHLYESVANTPIFIEWGGRPYREREVMLPWSLGVPLPGWKPKISLLDGIKATLDI